MILRDRLIKEYCYIVPDCTTILLRYLPDRLRQKQCGSGPKDLSSGGLVERVSSTAPSCTQCIHNQVTSSAGKGFRLLRLEVDRSSVVWVHDGEVDEMLPM